MESDDMEDIMGDPVWNVEDKLSSWRIQRFRMDQQEEHSTRGGAIQCTVREIVPVVKQH